MSEEDSDLVGVADEYGTIWQGEPGASKRIGDLVQRGDEETFEIRLSGLAYIHEKLGEMTPEKRLGFAWWLRSQIESNELEGQHETARQLRDLAAVIVEAAEKIEAVE